MLRTRCELLNYHELWTGRAQVEVLGRALLRELCLKEPGMELGAAEAAGGKHCCRECGVWSAGTSSCEARAAVPGDGTQVISWSCW